MITVGFTLIGDGKWSGGLNYQRTLLELIASEFRGRVDACVVVAPEHELIANDTFGPYLNRPLLVDRSVALAGVGGRAFRAALTGNDKVLAAFVLRHGIDVMFENARFFGRRFPVPIISWMPDFQHRHLPQLFTRRAWLKREVGYRAQTGGRRVILLSSETARDDFKAAYPRSRLRTMVARFSSAIDLDRVLLAAEGMSRKYELPEHFLFLPNQFWAHKNHRIVLEAVCIVRERRGGLAGFPPVVMSGPTTDYRDKTLFERTMARAKALEVDSHFLHLGLIPYQDVLALNAASLAVINPSLFEGWATSVEEAKSLGTLLLLSDIPVHREQAPGAFFFRPTDAEALARQMMDVSLATRKLADKERLVSASAARKAEFAEAFFRTIEIAASLD